VFKDISKRLNTLESKLGASEDPKTGLFLSIERLDDLTKKLKREIEHWQDEPPEWLTRTIRRTLAANPGYHPDPDLDLRSFKSLSSALARLEKDVEVLSETMSDYVKRHDYDKDLLDRSKELSSIREQLATSNGLLRGIMSALGYVDDKPKPKQR
jgi:hypothetical protein